MENSPDSPSPNNSAATDDRRDFLAKAAACACGGAAVLVPGAAAAVAFLNPLQQKSAAGQPVRLTTLQALPEDGTPRSFPAIADKDDAWTHAPNQVIGAVFLRRTGDKKQPVLALQVVCPHAGCAIHYERTEDGGKFFCPCHAASFNLDGHRTDEKSMSPRNMDPLDVDQEKLQQGEVWVLFQNFRTGASDSIPEV